MKQKSEEYLEGFIQGVIITSSHFLEIDKETIIKYMIDNLEKRK